MVWTMTRFLDWNGSGGVDVQDIATSIAVEETEMRETETAEDVHNQVDIASSNAGCLTSCVAIANFALFAVCACFSL